MRQQAQPPLRPASAPPATWQPEAGRQAPRTVIAGDRFHLANFLANFHLANTDHQPHDNSVEVFPIMSAGIVTTGFTAANGRSLWMPTRTSSTGSCTRARQKPAGTPWNPWVPFPV